MSGIVEEISRAIDLVEASLDEAKRRAPKEAGIQDARHSNPIENSQVAVKRAKAAPSSRQAQVLESSDGPRLRTDSSGAIPIGFKPKITEVSVKPSQLMSRRIVSYDGADHRSRPYDMLRTQVLQSMRPHKWKIIGVTSPTPGCGKTVTALNLAFSIARQPDESVALVDMDLQKPQIANCLGLRPAEGGVLDLLKRQTTLSSVAVPVRAGNQRIIVLPTAATKESSELMGSRAMGDLLQDMRRSFQSHIVILDLPPLLPSDDVIAVLPQIDCVLLVVAAGLSKASEVEECTRHLQLGQLLRVVVNKSMDANSNYYY
jgi:protein-tyrosine kinase